MLFYHFTAQMNPQNANADANMVVVPPTVRIPPRKIVSKTQLILTNGS